MRGPVGIGVQIVAAKCTRPRCTPSSLAPLPLVELRRLLDRVEDDDVGGEHRVVLVVDEKRMSA